MTDINIAALHRHRRLAAVCLTFGLLGGCVGDAAQAAGITIDPAGPAAAWAKAVGDMDGDGRLDIIVGGHKGAAPGLASRVLGKLGLGDPWASGGELVWYRNGDWHKHLISKDYHVRTDVEAADVNGDGVTDLVVLADRGVFLLQGPDFASLELDGERFHDVEVADLDRDGRPDIVLRNQSLFGYENGDRVTLLLQDARGGWRSRELAAPHGEGLVVADMDGDGYADVVINGIWLRNPGRHEARWRSVTYAPDWHWADVFVDAGDINGDGIMDIVQSPAEPAGDVYRMSWFEGPQDPHGRWIEHVLEDGIETVRHAARIGDFDGDGDADIFTAEMNQGRDPDEVLVYLNEGGGAHWRREVLATHGSHSVRVADVDGDFDVELIGANWQIDDYDGPYPVTLWDRPTESPRWQRHRVPGTDGRRHLFVRVADLDGDGWPDLAAGSKWYRNPQRLDGRWSAQPIGAGAATVVWLQDFDTDGAIDVLASRWDGRYTRPGLGERLAAKLGGGGYPGSGSGQEFVFARNLGGGRFEIHNNVAAASGDYLQGIAPVRDNERNLLALSWHRAGEGVQALHVPAAPNVDTWRWARLTDASQDEQLSAADIDGDGVTDLVTGTAWLDGERGWRATPIVDTDERPDRNRVADVNGDGRLDVIVGYEAVSVAGKLAWYEQTADGWTEHLIDRPVGPMSLGVADMDEDGDIDIVVGEHDLRAPERARVILYENIGARFRPQLIGRGDEHHNGLNLIDLDRDGDRDVVSVGWGHPDILIYENLAR